MSDTIALGLDTVQHNSLRSFLRFVKGCICEHLKFYGGISPNVYVYCESDLSARGFTFGSLQDMNKKTICYFYCKS